MRQSEQKQEDKKEQNQASPPHPHEASWQAPHRVSAKLVHTDALCSQPWPPPPPPPPACQLYKVQAKQAGRAVRKGLRFTITTRVQAKMARHICKLHKYLLCEDVQIFDRLSPCSKMQLSHVGLKLRLKFDLRHQPSVHHRWSSNQPDIWSWSWSPPIKLQSQSASAALASFFAQRTVQ